MAIDAEDCDRRSSDGRTPNKLGAIPLEMLVPIVRSGMEKSRDLSVIGVQTRDVWSLGIVAGKARKRQVVGLGGSAMLSRNDMINLERQVVIDLRNPAVFARLLRPLPNQSLGCCIHASGFNRGIERSPRPGFHKGEEVSDAFVIIELIPLLF